MGVLINIELRAFLSPSSQKGIFTIFFLLATFIGDEVGCLK
jgi:hypothetical protein